MRSRTQLVFAKEIATFEVFCSKQRPKEFKDQVEADLVFI